MTSPRQRISQIDRQLDQIYFAVETLEGRRLRTAEQWQDAWDRHPELRAQENDLYRQRGALQQERDALDHKEWLSTKRASRVKCPACGQHTYKAAA